VYVSVYLSDIQPGLLNIECVASLDTISMYRVILHILSHRLELATDSAVGLNHLHFPLHCRSRRHSRRPIAVHTDIAIIDKCL